jgi:hypothetical protein
VCATFAYKCFIDPTVKKIRPARAFNWFTIPACTIWNKPHPVATIRLDTMADLHDGDDGELVAIFARISTAPRPPVPMTSVPPAGAIKPCARGQASATRVSNAGPGGLSDRDVLADCAVRDARNRFGDDAAGFLESLIRALPARPVPGIYQTLLTARQAYEAPTRPGGPASIGPTPHGRSFQAQSEAMLGRSIHPAQPPTRDSGPAASCKPTPQVDQRCVGGDDDGMPELE